MIKPILYIFSGLPGAGKTTLATLLSQRLGATYFRVDAIEQALKDVCGLKVYAEGYRLAYVLAQDNLKQGLSVIADSCNSIPKSRMEWQEVAADMNLQYINIEVKCSDVTEHKRRIETRSSSIANLSLPTWSQVQNREYSSWKSSVISIDTAGRTAEQSINELIKALSPHY